VGGFKTTVRLENDAFPGVNQSFETLQPDAFECEVREMLDLVVRGLSNPENCERLVITAEQRRLTSRVILQEVDLPGRCRS
jgi:hypothetical protein